MASTIPPVKGQAFSCEVSLVSQADTNVFKTSVTLAAGDVTVQKDGGTPANIATLPTESGSTGILTVALSTSEMNADRVTVRFHDASGSEWQDLLVHIQTAAQTHDTTDAAVDAIASAALDAAGVRSAVGLASANLDTQIGLLATAAAVAALNDLSTADVNAQVVDALATDTYAEPGQGAPAATASLSTKLGYLYKVMRNKLTQTATQLSIYNDAGDTVDQKATTSDDGTTFTRGEIESGP